MRLHILGLGPIGCLLANNLRRVLPAQHIITLIHKSPEERLHLIQQGSICVERRSGNILVEGFNHEVSVKQLAALTTKATTSPILDEVKSIHNTPIDSLFVALKAQQTVSALRNLAPRLSSNSTVVLFQNGMGIYEQLVSQVFQNPEQRPHFVIASNTHGAFVKHQFYVVHAGMGSIEFGIAPDTHGRDFESNLHNERIDPNQRRLRIADISPPSDREAERYKTLRETVAALLLMQELNVSWKPLTELQVIMQRKLVVNAAINPLSAMFGCRNGELFTAQYSRDLLLEICQEASAVFAAKLHHDNQRQLGHLQESGVDTRNIELPTLPEELLPPSLEEHVLKVAEQTKGNVSSMLQDIRCGRKTEIEFINGYIEDVGKAYGVPTPVNATLRKLVKMKYFIPLDQFI